VTKNEAIISWLNWLKESIEKKIDIAESDINEAKDTREEAEYIVHFISEGIEEDLGRFERGVKREIQKLEVENEV
jgi:predicted methyltransferase MtxX (methanogen marker protein 4)